MFCYLYKAHAFSTKHPPGFKISIFFFYFSFQLELERKIEKNTYFEAWGMFCAKSLCFIRITKYSGALIVEICYMCLRVIKKKVSYGKIWAML